MQSYRGATHSFVLDEELSRKLKALSRREGVTLFMVLLGAYGVLLSRYSGAEEVVVGTPVAGRTRMETEGLIGFFVNTLALRVKVQGERSFREVLEGVRRVALGGYEHQELPFEKLVEELQPERDLSRNPLFQTVLVLQNAAEESLEMPGLSWSPLPVNNTTAKFDLSLSLADTERGLAGTAEYNLDLFEPSTISRMMGHLKVLLEGVLAEPERSTSDLPLLSQGERQQLLVEWNATAVEYPREQGLHQLFEVQAERTPRSVALVAPDGELTYGELNCRANQLAHYLRRLGVGPEVRVCICAERSSRMVVGMLAILKAGGAYVPLDPAYPAERILFTLRDADAPVLLTERRLLDQLPLQTARVVCLDSDWERICLESAENPRRLVTDENLAYVIYTSGSTGVPKGVAIQHSSAVTLLHWAHETFTAEDLSVVLASTSICFDLSVFELFVPLSMGGKVALAGNFLELNSLPAAQEITLVNTVPSAITELLRNDNLPASVRVANLAGEPLSNQLAQMIYERGIERVYNLYGPSEDTTYSTYALVERGANVPVSIGRPIAQTRTYILDQHLEPVPVGVIGEIYISGEGLARGYLHRPEATAEKFIPNPFSEQPGARLYRTGDLARYLSDGTIDFLGRNDHQVKLRGFRIELGEIEALLARHEAIRESLVMVREDAEGERKLIAYLIAEQGAGIGVSELRSYLKERLPHYMVPSAFVWLEALPLTPNGKVDRRALPAPDQSRQELADRLVAPRTPVEEMLAGIWSEVLKVEQVGVYDNFFDLGGHSLLATQIISRTREIFHIELPLRCLFESPTVADLSEQIERARRDAPEAISPPLVPAPRAGRMPLSFAQQRLWFLDQLEPGNTVYHISVAAQLRGQLDIAALESAFHEIIKRHESLRASFDLIDDQPQQLISDSLTPHLSLIDLSLVPPHLQNPLCHQLLQRLHHASFTLSSPPLLRSSLLRCSADHHIFSLTIHHIISDGWSLALFIRELISHYSRLIGIATAELPALPIQYADYAHWQREWLTGERLGEQLSYWREQLAGAPRCSSCRRIIRDQRCRAIAGRRTALCWMKS